MTSALELLPAQDLAGGSAPNRRERKAATFAACAAICGRSSRMFFHWQRLAGEGRLVQEQILRCQHTRVRWHHVACRQPDDVSRNEDAKRHLLLAAVADDCCRVANHRLEPRRGGIGSGFLDKAQRDTQHDHREDDDRRTDVAGEKSDQPARTAGLPAGS